MEWYNSNAILIFYCQCEKKPKTTFNHIFALTKYYKIKSIDLALLIDLERNEPREVSCSRTETRTCNRPPVCFQEDISSWLTDTHRLLTTTGNLLQIKPHKTSTLLHWHHHTTTLTAIQPHWHLLFLCTVACPGQGSTFNCALPQSLWEPRLGSAQDPAGLSWDDSVKQPALHH